MAAPDGSPLAGVHAFRFEVTSASIDGNGHVNNLEYLRWMQEVAIAHSAAAGWPMDRYAAEGTAWVVRKHAIEYVRPAFAGERLVALTWVEGFRAHVSPRGYLFWRERDRAVVAKAQTLWVYVDAATGRPAKVPAAFRECFDLVRGEDAVLDALAAWSPG
ncbi:MAG: acyl-CoA thioesterase [Betaproteobacteria bacterium]|nr:acyl-CoA thioesterase [Betaproteobacteria bacterium]MDH5285886.1 acyl-CoA thioesterase [Betaproteobacteria bacterium]